jgi:hypothetical protein
MCKIEKGMHDSCERSRASEQGKWQPSSLFASRQKVEMTQFTSLLENEPGSSATTSR